MSVQLTPWRRLAFYGVLGCAAVLSTCSPRPTPVQKVLKREQLRVAIVESPTTCYESADGPTGFECDLLRGLARKMGVAPEFSFVDSAHAATAAVIAGTADLAAGGVVVDPNLAKMLRYSAPIEEVRLQLVYHGQAGVEKPDSLEDAQPGLSVVAGSSAEAYLNANRAAHASLQWHTATDSSEEDLIDAVAEGDDVDFTLAPSNLVAMERRYYPTLRVAFDVTQPQPVAWAMRSTEKEALALAVDRYLGTLDRLELARLRDRYFGQVTDYDYLGVARFAEDVQKRLPRYQRQFRAAAVRNGLDWRLLAAIGYQESHWDPDAVSHTGVRGLMMLTTDTALELDVVNRDDPAQSIAGAALYLSRILAQLPPTIAEPDRTWMALAAYNQGVGHLLDARDLALQMRGDANRWLDVRNALPLLSRPRWFRATKHGYARGREAVNFVGNVRNYYDILNWIGSNNDDAPKPPATTRAAGSVPTLASN